MQFLIEFYSALNRLSDDHEKAMNKLQMEAVFSRSILSWADVMEAVKENQEMTRELIAHFDIDSVEYAIRNQIPY